MEPSDTIPENRQESSDKNPRRHRIIKRILLWVLALWALLLAVIQIALSPSVLTRAANEFSGKYIDGTVSFGKVSLSVLSNFPNLNITFDTVSVTYPSDRFAKYEKGSKPAGRGNGADTLMSFSRFSASVNIAALAIRQIRIPALVLDKPRIFARSYDEGLSNWDIIKSSGESGQAEEDSSSAGIPKIVLGRIQLSDSPLIIYHSAKDSTDIVLNMKRLQFNGRLDMDKMGRKRIDFKLDSLFLAGSFPADSIALALDQARISATKGQIRANAKATTYLATRSYGRIRLPVRISSRISFPKDTVPAVSFEGFRAEIAGIPIKADTDIRFCREKGIYIKGEAEIDRCKISDVLKYINKTIWKDASEIQTDAELSMSASCDGYYSAEGGRMPNLTASLQVPSANIGHKAYGSKNEIRLDARLKGNENGVVDIVLNDFHISGKALEISAKGSANDIIGQDPLFDVSSDAIFRLDTLGRIVKSERGIAASGELSAGFKGKIRMSQLDPYLFSQADVNGFMKCDRLGFRSEKDSVDLMIDSMDVWLGAVGNTRDTSISQGERMLALTVALDSAKVRYKNSMFIRGRGLSLKAQNSAAILDSGDSSKFYPFGGRLEIGFLAMLGSDTTAVMIDSSDNIFKISPKKGYPEIPVLTLKSISKGIFLRGPVNRVGVKGLEMDATAAMNSIERRQRAKAFVDSLAKKYPDIPRDSLFIYLRSKYGSRVQTPEWLTENDFKKQDLQFSLDSSIVKVIRGWDAEGSLSFTAANILTPYFPLRNTLHNVHGRFNSNEIDLDSFTLKSGTSALSATGKMKGLRGVVTGRGMLGLEMDIRSDSLNLNELLGAYSVGSGFTPDKLSVQDSSITEIGDSEYQEMIVTDTLENAIVESSSLVVVPANINAELTLDARNVRFSDLEISGMQSRLAIKERCIQFTNTSARSGIGNIDFEGFYSTRTKQDLKTGFDLRLSDVTAEKVVEMLPAVDTIMPMLTSFKGKLNCELAATADIDTNMNIVTPSLKGVVRIKGDNLTMQDSEGFRQIAKKLMFKDKQTGHIDRMSVEGLLSDNRLEIFPFILDIDRYTLAMSGIQNLDMSFKYHISVIDSPLPFRLGVDIYGDNFDNVKYKIGKAKYKNTNIPVFTAVVDQTRLNLKESIDQIFTKGVDKAIKENERLKAIEDYKQKIDYTQAVDEQLDSLSDEEKQVLEKEE